MLRREFRLAVERSSASTQANELHVLITLSVDMAESDRWTLFAQSLDNVAASVTALSLALELVKSAKSRHVHLFTDSKVTDLVEGDWLSALTVVFEGVSEQLTGWTLSDPLEFAETEIASTKSSGQRVLVFLTPNALLHPLGLQLAVQAAIDRQELCTIQLSPAPVPDCGSDKSVEFCQLASMSACADPWISARCAATCARLRGDCTGGGGLLVDAENEWTDVPDNGSGLGVRSFAIRADNLACLSAHDARGSVRHKSALAVPPLLPMPMQLQWYRPWPLSPHPWAHEAPVSWAYIGIASARMRARRSTQRALTVLSSSASALSASNVPAHASVCGSALLRHGRQGSQRNRTRRLPFMPSLWSC